MKQAALYLQSCPSDDELACFMEGQTASALADRIRSHVDTCESCRQLIANTLRADTETQPVAPRVLDARTFSVGEVLNRRFRILRFIAKGGMGEVYEARDIQLGENVALKTIVCTGLDNARLVPRLRAEVQMARRVTHPNVCRILEFGTTEARAPGTEVVPYFTMEYLRGSTLKEYLNRHGRLPAAEVVSLATQILDGLDAVHTAGIIHRDLKTENVFLIAKATGSPRAVVMDFGLARSMATQDPGSGLSSDALVGTPAYMAPEQVMGGEPSPGWDIYALGVMAFELLSGKLPFAGKTAVATAMARIRELAPPLSSIIPEIEPELDAVVATCLQADPARRFPSAIAARDAFNRTRHTRRMATDRRGRGLGLFVVAAALGLIFHLPISADRQSLGAIIDRSPSTSPVSAPTHCNEMQRLTAEGWSNTATAGPPLTLQVAPANTVAANTVAANGNVPDLVGEARKIRQRPKRVPRPAGNAPVRAIETREVEILQAVPSPARMEAADDLAIPDFARRQRRVRMGGQ